MVDNLETWLAFTDLVFIDLPDVGDNLSKGEQFGEIESVKAVSDLKSPVNGEVVEINEALVDELGAVASDPYGEGWMIKIKSSDDGAKLMSVGDYDRLVAEQA